MRSPAASGPFRKLDLAEMPLQCCFVFVLLLLGVVADGVAWRFSLHGDGSLVQASAGPGLPFGCCKLLAPKAACVVLDGDQEGEVELHSSPVVSFSGLKTTDTFISAAVDGSVRLVDGATMAAMQ